MPHNLKKAKKSKSNMKVNLNEMEKYLTVVKSKLIAVQDKSLKVGILVSWL